MGEDRSSLDLLLEFQRALNEPSEWPSFLASFKTYLGFGGPDVGLMAVQFCRDTLLDFQQASDNRIDLKNKIIDICQLYMDGRGNDPYELISTFPASFNSISMLSVNEIRATTNIDHRVIYEASRDQRRATEPLPLHLLVFRIAPGCDFLFWRQDDNFDRSAFATRCGSLGSAMKGFLENYRRFGQQDKAPDLWRKTFHLLPVPACMIDEKLNVIGKNARFDEFLELNGLVEVDGKERLFIAKRDIHNSLADFMALCDLKTSSNVIWSRSCYRSGNVTRLYGQRTGFPPSLRNRISGRLGILTFDNFKVANIEQFLEFGLTKTEMEVVTEVCLGASNTEIATNRNKSPDTINSQVKSILRKTGAKKRAELILMASMDFGRV